MYRIKMYFLNFCVNIKFDSVFLQNVLDEDLIKWGWPEDVWFHVDKVSSAHVYLRLRQVCSITAYFIESVLSEHVEQIKQVYALGTNN